MSLSDSHIPLAQSGSPLPQGAENRDRILALLLRLAVDIALLPIVLVVLAAGRVAQRVRRAPGAWYLSDSDQAEIDALSPRARRAIGRALAVIGWLLAGHRNRGMRPSAYSNARCASAIRPHCAARAPPTRA